MRAYLKIKLLSLTAEAKIIKKEERKFFPYRNDEGTRRDIYWGLRHHRIFDVRSESRSANLAYGFLRGRPYAALEKTCRTRPDWSRVDVLIKKYGGKSLPKNSLSNWEKGVDSVRQAA